MVACLNQNYGLLSEIGLRQWIVSLLEEKYRQISSHLKRRSLRRFEDDRNSKKNKKKNKMSSDMRCVQLNLSLFKKPW